MPTSTFNCPVCKTGNIVITLINTVAFEGLKLNITGIVECDNCGATYELKGKDVTLR